MQDKTGTDDTLNFSQSWHKKETLDTKEYYSATTSFERDLGGAPTRLGSVSPLFLRGMESVLSITHGEGCSAKQNRHILLPGKSSAPGAPTWSSSALTHRPIPFFPPLSLYTCIALHYFKLLHWTEGKPWWATGNEEDHSMSPAEGATLTDLRRWSREWSRAAGGAARQGQTVWHTKAHNQYFMHAYWSLRIVPIACIPVHSPSQHWLSPSKAKHPVSATSVPPHQPLPYAPSSVSQKLSHPRIRI